MMMESHSDKLEPGFPTVEPMQLQPHISDSFTHHCQHCDKGFSSAQALTMHVIRMHTHREKATKAAVAASRRAKSRIYNANYRARNIAKGLDARGNKLKKKDGRKFRS